MLGFTYLQLFRWAHPTLLGNGMAYRSNANGCCLIRIGGTRDFRILRSERARAFPNRWREKRGTGQSHMTSAVRGGTEISKYCRTIGCLKRGLKWGVKYEKKIADIICERPQRGIGPVTFCNVFCGRGRWFCPPQPTTNYSTVNLIWSWISNTCRVSAKFSQIWHSWLMPGLWLKAATLSTFEVSSLHPFP